MRKPYREKQGEVEGKTVWIVDGAYIRKNINREFTNFGQHYRFHFIPHSEFWIDHESHPDETFFFIEHLLVEHRLMARGTAYTRALKAADRIERRERKRHSVIAHRVLPHRILANIRRRFLKSYSERVHVWVVNGELVRDSFDIDFTEGGHDKVYAYVPENEVWIDDDVAPRERPLILLHELHERRLMQEGWPYHRAHRSASEHEYMCRHHPHLLDEKLREELRQTRQRVAQVRNAA